MNFYDFLRFKLLTTLCSNDFAYIAWNKKVEHKSI